MARSPVKKPLTQKAVAAARPRAAEYTLWDGALAHFGARVSVRVHRPDPHAGPGDRAPRGFQDGAARPLARAGNGRCACDVAAEGRFGTRFPRRASPRHVSTRSGRGLGETGLYGVRLHDARHTHASLGVTKRLQKKCCGLVN